MVGSDSDSSGEFAQVDESLFIDDLGRNEAEGGTNPLQKKGTIIERQADVNTT